VNSAPTATIGFGDLLRLLKRQRWIVLGVLGLTVAISLVYTLRQPRRYTAVCRLEIDLNTPKSSLSIESVPQAAEANEQKMATQLGILTSQTIALEVVDELGLNKDPDFMGPNANPKPLAQYSDFEKFTIAQRFRNGLGVEFEKGTEIAQIKYTSLRPDLSASIANAIATQYIQNNFKTKFNITQQTSTWLTGQLETLRKQVGEAEEAFADFQRQTGLLQTEEGHSATLDRITQLSTALAAAQTLRILKEISYKESLGTAGDQVLPPSTIAVLTALRTNQASVQAELASLSIKFGENYPRVAQLRNQLAAIDTSIADAVAHGRQQLRSDYEASVDNEHKLNAELEGEKQRVFALNENGLKYSILQRRVISTRNLYEDLTTKLREAEITSGLSSDSLSIVDPALAPNIPSQPRRQLNMAVGILLGLVLGIASAIVFDSINASVRTLKDVETYSQLPVLGLVPHGDVFGTGQVKIGVVSEPRSHFAESFRGIRSSILLSSAGSPPQVIAICSAWPKEGKSTVSLNLAIVLAQAGRRVLLVDADLRRPTLHFKLGGLRNSFGLSTLLTRRQEDASSAFITPLESVPTLDLLTAGPTPPSASELLLSSRMKELVSEWRSVYDFIIFDTAPVLAVSDTTSIAAIADTSVAVVRAGKTRRQALRGLRDAILNVHGKIAGIVLNDVKANSEAYYDYYGGQKDYGSYYTGGAEVHAPSND